MCALTLELILSKATDLLTAQHSTLPLALVG
jgi:hypothetical protein